MAAMAVAVAMPVAMLGGFDGGNESESEVRLDEFHNVVPFVFSL
jgi:hypothetical protein